MCSSPSSFRSSLQPHQSYTQPRGAFYCNGLPSAMNGVLSGVREEGFQAADALPDSKKESKAELSPLLAPEFLLGVVCCGSLATHASSTEQMCAIERLCLTRPAFKGL